MASNGHHNDDMPDENEYLFPEEHNQQSEAEYPPNAPPPPTNYNQAGLKDLFVGRDDRSQRRDPIDRMATSSDRIEEYLPLARLDRRDLARHKRQIASINNINLGHSDPMHILWFGWAGSIAIGGEGRKEIVAMVTAEKQYMRQQRHNQWRNMTDRARGDGGNND